MNTLGPSSPGPRVTQDETGQPLVRRGQARPSRVGSGVLGPETRPQALLGSEPQGGNPHDPHLLRTTRPWRLQPPSGPQFPLPKSGLCRLSVCARVNTRRAIQEVLASHLPGRGSREGERAAHGCVSAITLALPAILAGASPSHRGPQTPSTLSRERQAWWYSLWSGPSVGPLSSSGEAPRSSSIVRGAAQTGRPRWLSW